MTLPVVEIKDKALYYPVTHLDSNHESSYNLFGSNIRLINPQKQPGLVVFETFSVILKGFIMSNQLIQLSPSWLAILEKEFEKPYMQQLKQFLMAEKQAGKQILPKSNLWFNAFNSTPFEQVKVVILGQDPYPTPGHAHGLSFSVLPGVQPLPKSLQNINKELQSDCQIDNQHSGDLQPWADQGVLLLNAVLTVEAGKANAHQNHGWETFTDAVIQTLASQRQNLVFILWGAYAQKKGRFISADQHGIIQSPHPSPLSAYRGFFGSRPFSRTNQYLQNHGLTPIDWQLPH